MNFKKRLLALLCALALLAGAALTVAASFPDTTIYLLAVNDKMADLPGGLRPESVSGVIYVPYTAFDRAFTGVDLGVYYGIDRTQGMTLTLYSMESMLVFRVYMGICEDSQGNRMSFRAVIRNGIPYVPAVAVCNHFGLNYSYMPTPDRGTLIRVTNGMVSMNDQFFLSSAATAMTYRYNNIIQSMTPQPTTTPTPTPALPPRPTPTPDREELTVYLAVDMTASGGNGEVTYGTKDILLLFPVEYLTEHSDRVRKAVAGGYSVGLIADGTRSEVLEQLKRGNELLSHIARIRTHIVSAPEELTEELTGAGWACWRPNMAVNGVDTTLANLANRRTTARLTLSAGGENGSASDQIIRRILWDDKYTIHRPLETDLGS